jgi:hypothetical protein
MKRVLKWVLICAALWTWAAWVGHTSFGYNNKPFFLETIFK